MEFTNATEVEETCILPNYALYTGLISVISIMIIGILGNAAVCIILCTCRKRFDTVSHIFVANVALSDLLTSLTVLPFDILYWRNFPVFPLSQNMCRLWNALFFAFLAESSIGLCTISIDIFIAITRPLHYNMLLTSKRAHGVVVISWIWSIAVGILMYFYQEEPPLHEYLFDLSSPAYGSYLILHIGTPSIIIPLLYANIFFIARSHAKKILPARSQNENAKATNKLSLKKQLVMAKTFFLITVSFFLCWYPFFIVQLFYVFKLEEKVNWCKLEITDTIVCWFAYLQCCLNPILYAFRRKDVMTVIRRSTRRKNLTQSINDTTRQDATT